MFPSLKTQIPIYIGNGHNPVRTRLNWTRSSGDSFAIAGEGDSRPLLLLCSMVNFLLSMCIKPPAASTKEQIPTGQTRHKLAGRLVGILCFWSMPPSTGNDANLRYDGVILMPSGYYQFWENSLGQTLECRRSQNWECLFSELTLLCNFYKLSVQSITFLSVAGLTISKKSMQQFLYRLPVSHITLASNLNVHVVRKQRMGKYYYRFVHEKFSSKYCTKKIRFVPIDLRLNLDLSHLWGVVSIIFLKGRQPCPPSCSDFSAEALCSSSCFFLPSAERKFPAR